MKRFLIIIVTFSLMPVFKNLAQENEMASIVKEQLSPEGKKKIAKADKYLTASKNDKSQAEKLEGSKKKSLRMEISSSKNLGKANKIKYKVYRKDFEKFTDIDRNDSAKVIKKKMLRAKKNMKRSSNKREAAMKLTSDDDIFSLLKHADELETKAFNDIYYAYSLILGKSDIKTDVKNTKPVEDNVNNEITESELIPVKTVVGDPNSEEDVPVSGEDKIKSETIIDPKINENQNSDVTNNSNNKITDESVNEENINSNVYFKIQIAASKTQLSVENLIKNFPTKEVLNVEIEDGWYKYSIRKKFISYEEALKYKTDLNTKGTFLLAFKNGKKVSIEEALKKEPVENVNITVKENTIENIKPETVGKTSYKLQIGLSITPLNATEVAQYKNGGKEVFAIDCGSWFIYTIGEFETESAALSFKKQKGLNEAEVVKFIDGKLVQD